jgi:hypothetical protein
MGSGRADYSVPYVDSATKNVYVDQWANNDSGGMKLKGDGTRFCDMT